VPMLSCTVPGSKTPDPRAAAAESPAPADTGVLEGRASSAATAGRRCPATEPENGSISGRRSARMPSAAMTSWSHPWPSTL
jgi:hypothetical protein